MGRSGPRKGSRRRTKGKSPICGNFNHGNNSTQFLDGLTSIKSPSLGRMVLPRNIARESPGAESGSAGNGDVSVVPNHRVFNGTYEVLSLDEAIAVDPDYPALETNGSPPTPSDADTSFHNRWMELVPHLVPDYLDYMSRSHEKMVQAPPSTLTEECTAQCRSSKLTQILCLFHDDFKHITVATCHCRSVQSILVRNGLFPASPSQTKIAVSIDVMESSSPLFQPACNAVNTQVKNGRGPKFKESFRKSTAAASQWLDVLKLRIKGQVDKAIENAAEIGDALLPPISGISASEIQSPCSKTLPKDGTSADNTVSDVQYCSRFLRQLCPACFNLESFGRSLDVGGDFHLSTGANFHHRHAAKAGPGIPFHTTQHIISKEFVDEVVDRIDQEQKQAPRIRSSSRVALQGTKGHKEKLARDKYDEYGLMSLVCRHGVPLFFAVIDSAGETQQYAVALILWFFNHVPPSANVIVLCDDACIFDRNAQMYNSFPRSIKSRIRFATATTHAYCHQWSCQLTYNPILCQGLGNTDGEGVEQVWLRMRPLSAVAPTSSVARNRWLTDTFIAAVADDARTQLGRRLNSQFLDARKQGAKAKSQIISTGLSDNYLREQWALQKEAHLELGPRCTSNLTKKLNKLQETQSRIDEIVSQQAKNAKLAKILSRARRPQSKPMSAYDVLEANRLDLVAKQEHLYTSIHVHFEGTYPSFRGLAPDFRTLLIKALVLKRDIRRQAIQFFFDVDCLDKSATGNVQASGLTAKHTRSTISASSPLCKHIKKYNKYCKRLSELHDPNTWEMRLPKELPTAIQELRSSHCALWQNVEWDLARNKKTPVWIEDPETRRGIHALLPWDRCSEEMGRLQLESNNMLRWFGSELLATDIAIRLPENRKLILPLKQHRDRILQLQCPWASDLIPSNCFEQHIQTSTAIANTFCDSRCQNISHNHNTTLSNAAQELWSPNRISIPHDNSTSATTRGILINCLDEEDDCINNEGGCTKIIDCCEASLCEEGVCAKESHWEDGMHRNEMDARCDEYRLYTQHELQGGAINLPHEDFGMTWNEGILIDGYEENATKRDGDEKYANEDSIDNMQLESLDLVDSSLPIFIESFHRFQFILQPHVSHIHSHTTLSDTTIQLLRDPKGRLTNICVDDCAYILQFLLLCHPSFSDHSRRCAVFTAYEITPGSHVADDALWNLVHRTRFWEKDIWILPIHQPSWDHWVLCVGYPKNGGLYLIDSLGCDEADVWAGDLYPIVIVFGRLVAIANEHGHALKAKQWRIACTTTALELTHTVQ